MRNKIVSLPELIGRRRQWSVSRMTRNGRVLTMEYPDDDYPALVPAHEFVGTRPRDWMDRATSDYVIGHLHNPGREYEITISSGGNSLKRGGVAVAVGRNEVTVYQWPVDK